MEIAYITGKLREWHKEAAGEYEKIRTTGHPLVFNWCELAGKLDDAYESAKRLAAKKEETADPFDDEPKDVCPACLEDVEDCTCE